MFDDIPIEIKIYLNDKFKNKWPNVTKSDIKMCLLNELNIRGKDVKKIVEKYLVYLKNEYIQNSNFIKGE